MCEPVGQIIGATGRLAETEGNALKMLRKVAGKEVPVAEKEEKERREERK